MPIHSKNYQLVISTVIVTIIAMAYGCSPSTTLPLIFDFKVESTDLKQVFRATMGLYAGMAALWIYGVINPRFWRTATLSNIFFMTGLATGRILGLLLDGIPSMAFVTGLVLELILAIWGIINLQRTRSPNQSMHPPTILF